MRAFGTHLWAHHKVSSDAAEAPNLKDQDGDWRTVFKMKDEL